MTPRAADAVWSGGRVGGLLPGPRDRALFANFLRRELTTRYLGSVTGLAWALLHPLALLAVYHFVFTTSSARRASRDQSFLAFVAVALWPWLAAQEAMQRGTVSIAGYARADPQGRVPARDRRLRVGGGDARAAVRRLSRRAGRAARLRRADPLRGPADRGARCGWCWLSRSPGITLVARGAAGVRHATSSTC